MIKKVLIPYALLVLLVTLLIPLSPLLAAPPTTSITITKYAADGTTVLDQTTVSYEWMMSNLPVQGDGVTHYYHQGPTFDMENKWDPDETTNIDSRDMGAVKGTDVKDLCELLAGGASPGDKIEIKSSDGFSKKFGYEDVYNPEAAQGKMAVCWYEAEYGYVPDYDTGLRLVFLAQAPNAEGKYVFGNRDMQETLAEEYWHYYVNYPDYWPSSGGLSVKWVDEINIMSSEEIQEQTSEPTTTTTTTSRKTVGIAADRDSIDFGGVSAGDTSLIETLNILNTGNTDINISLEVATADAESQGFYEQALCVNSQPYNNNEIIMTIEAGQTGPVSIQLKVPEDTEETGPPETQFIFWAEASD